ncbi:MAG: response regulator [Chlorobiales bacterium]|nr:response regulator [Chlorobiales bacterium]
MSKTVLQGKDGLIWVATDAGLVYYDGMEFTTLNSNLPRPPVKYLMTTAKKDLLIVTNMGAGYVRKDSGVKPKYRYESLISAAGFPSDTALFSPRAAYQDKHGSLWFSEPNSIVRFANKKLRRYYFDAKFTDETTESPFLFAEDKYGRLIAATNNGKIIFFDAASDSFLRFPVEPPASGIKIHIFGNANKGEIWAGTSHGLYKLVIGDNFLRPQWQKLVEIENVSSYAVTPSGDVYIGTLFTGVYTWKLPTVAKALPQKITTLPFSIVNSLTLDTENSLWVASDEGVAIVQLTSFDEFPLGSMTLFTRSIVAASNGDVIVTEHDGVYRISQKQGIYTARKIFSGTTGRFYQPAGDSSGTWISEKPGILTYIGRNGTKTIVLSQKNRQLSSYWPNFMSLDRNGNLWCYQAGQKILRLSRNKKITLYGEDKGVSGTINTIKQAKNNIVYLAGTGNDNYLFQYDPATDSFKNLSIPLPSDPKVPFVVHDINTDSKGVLWLGTSQGLFRYFKGEIKKDSLPDKYGKSVIKAVEIDKKDRVWLGTERGLLLYADGEITPFNKLDGLPGPAVVHRAFSFDSRDRLWVGTSSGLAYWQLPVDRINKTSKPSITSLVVNDEHVDLKANQDALPNRATLSAAFASLSYPGQSLQFQTRVLGLQSEWSSAANQPNLVLPPMPSGEYTLQVKAQQSGDLWSDVMEYHFVVAPPWYAKEWMVVVYSLLIVVTLGFIKKFRSAIQDKARADEERQKLISLIEYSSECILMVSPKGRLVFLNAAGQWLLGERNPEDMDTDRKSRSIQNRRVFEYIHPEDSLFFRKIVVPAVIEQGQWSGELHFQHIRTKQQIPVLCSAFTIKHPVTGQPLAYAAISSDITIRKKVERELIEAREEAMKSAKTKSDFLANMSHEIRTPMNAVIGMTGLLLETPLSGEQREYVETVRTSGDALLNVINDILDFSKIESGKLELERYPFGLRTAIEESIDIFAATAAEKEIELTYFIHDGVPPKVSGDVTRLRQIMVNLVGNAVKFTSEGEVVVEVDLIQSEQTNLAIYGGDMYGGMPEEDRRVLLHFSVRDTGIGIPEDRMDYIFSSFSQVDTSTTRKYGGTGLGLSISKHLCELMNGSMWVESEVGKGSIFHFTVDFDIVDEPKVEVSGQLAGKRALIVDDNATNRRILSLISASWGMASTAVPSGPEALNLIRAGNHYDVAILDFHMPEMDGLMLAAEIRKIPETNQLPLIMLTSAGNREVISEIGGIGLAAYLNKPTKQSQLYDILVSIFDKARAGDAKPQSSTKATIEMGQRLPLRILIAEDNAVNQRLVLRILEKMGYRADVAGNGLEVIDALKHKSYDIVLMDVQMPEMDGIEATMHICQNWPRAERPFIIAMTANAMKGDREACLEAGMDDYLSKPVRFTDLQKAIEKWGWECNMLHGTSAAQDTVAPAPFISQALMQETPGKLPVIDPYTFSSLRDMCQASGGSQLAEIIKMFLSDTENQIAQLQKATENPADLKHLAHSLKGSCLMVGANVLANVCMKLEILGKADKTDGAVEMVEELVREFHAVRMELTKVLEKETSQEKIPQSNQPS